MRILLGLVLLLALATPASALALPALPALQLPSLIEVAPADAGAPAVAPPVTDTGVAARAPLRVDRQYLVLDVERKALAAPAALDAETEAPAPMVARVASVDVAPPRAVDTAPPPFNVHRDQPVVAQSAAPAAEPTHADATPLAVVATTSLAAGGLVHLALAMYHRIAPSQALRHTTRAAVHAEVTRRGHATAGEIAHALNLHPKTARYHLDLLAGFSLLVRDADGAYRAPGAPRAAEPTIEESILELVSTRPGLSMADVARELNIGKSTAQDRVTQLLLERRLESRRDVRARLLFPAAVA